MPWIILILLSLTLLGPLPAAAERPAAAPAYQLNREQQGQFEAMSPDERAAVLQQANKKWAELDAEEKKKLEDQAMAKFKALSPAAQQKLKAEALKQWQSMSPEEQQELRSNFSDILKGDLQLDPPS
ncbi:MAG: DUF3106 domain-containing protein [Proteobacteria bacterium]|nr:DUF3106 domain-containing protein [Pseudomonadota bacterium]